jgi:hypothetical protein
MSKEFVEFPKIARLSRECVITEKIDGTNASIHITEEGEFLTASRTQWITPEKDNYGFSRWAHEHKDELMKLGVGGHFGEWWGQGIQRKYGQDRKRFSLFNTHLWTDDAVRPACCDVVPILFKGNFDTIEVNSCLTKLSVLGSSAAPGFMKPEGIVIYHTAARLYFKKTIEKDEMPKCLIV